jgi:hypothetical protein
MIDKTCPMLTERVVYVLHYAVCCLQAQPIDTFNDAAIETVVFFANLLAYYKVCMQAL